MEVTKIYSGLPVIRPPLKHRKNDHIRGLVFGEGGKIAKIYYTWS
jgi:hypothetical protein